MLHHVVILGIRSHAIRHGIAGHTTHCHPSSGVTRIPRWCHVIAWHPLMHWSTLCRVRMSVHHVLCIHWLSIHRCATHSRMCVGIGTTNCCWIRSVGTWHWSLLGVERLCLWHMRAGLGLRGIDRFRCYSIRSCKHNIRIVKETSSEEESRGLHVPLFPSVRLDLLRFTCACAILAKVPNDSLSFRFCMQAITYHVKQKRLQDTTSPYQSDMLLNISFRNFAGVGSFFCE